MNPVVAARVRVPAPTWERAIRAAVHLLVGAGAVSQRYEDRCVAIVEEQGPYIVLAPGFALAHARPEDGARRLCISAVTLTRPVRFGHDANDPVDVVIAFGSPDRGAHIALLADLARALSGGLAAHLRAARTDAEATALLMEATRRAA